MILNNKNNILVLLSIILGCFIGVQNALTFKDITPSDRDYNKENIQYTFDGLCEFKKLVLCVAEDGETCGNTLVNSLNMNSSPLYSNGSASIYSLYSSEIVKGINLVTIESKIVYSLECIEIDLDSINLKVVNQFYKYLNYMSYEYDVNGIVKLEGIPNDQPFSIGTMNYESTKGTLTYLYSNYYMYNNNLNVVSDFMLSINVTLSNTQKSSTFPLNIIKESYIGITDVKYLPGLKDLVLPGYNEGPVISFTTNSTAYDSLYFLRDMEDILPVPKQYYPIYGNQSSTTFLLTPFNYNSASYQLFSQNKDVLSINHFFSIDNITQYSFKSPQINSIGGALLPNSFNSNNYGCFVFFSSIAKYSLTNFIVSVNSRSNTIRKAFPFGFLSGKVDSYSYGVYVSVLAFDASITSTAFLNVVSEVDNTGSLSQYQNPTTTGNSISPVIKNVETIHLVSDLYLYRVTADFQNQFYYITNQLKTIVYGPETLVSGDFSSGIFEFVFQPKSSIYFYDRYNNYKILEESHILNIDPVTIFESPYSNIIDYNSIKNVSFLYSTVDVTNYRQFNILYFNYSSDVSRDTVFKLSPTDDMLQDLFNVKQTSTNNMFYSTYNQSIQLFQIEFYVESNSPSGSFNFDLLYGSNYVSSGSFSTQLKVKSNNMDYRGPIINQMNISIPTITSNGPGVLIISIAVEDPINGFSNGYIIIKGELDLSIYNFTFSLGDGIGDKYLATYHFEINIKYPCVSQNYIITEARLLDQLNRVSFFSIFSRNRDYTSVMNPFINFINEVAFNKIYINCVDIFTPEDTTPPTLDSFKVSTSSIDVSKTNREITFTFKATDLESGIKTDQYPIVYLSTINNNVLECKSNITLITPNTTTSLYGNTIDYSCTIQLPIGFGYPNDIYLSVYGFINNNAYFSGFSPVELESRFTFYITTSFSNNEPNLQSYFRITEYDTDLWIFGNNLILDPMVYIKYSETSILSFIPIKTYSSAIQFSPPATSSAYEVFVILANGYQSNSLTITPIIFNYYNQTSPTPSSSESQSSSSSSSSSSTTPTMTPTETPLPTNAPQQCSGNPVCGGPSNGKCIPNQGCVCYSPWIGLDCSSQVIIVDKPTTNDTSPSTNITLPVNNNNNSNNSSTTVTYKSLITLVSIREINILGTVVFNKTFEKWQVRELDNTTFIYNTTLEIEKNNKVSTTDFKVTLKWFINETSITFANEQLIMNPSTMKYTIEINDYPFENNLNQLQLVMSASIQSNSSDNICSLREYGETTSGDNSNYLKIQVDNHSLYGRFIRRGIVDSTITTITNVLLDKDMNSITTTKELQSYIGIQIPNFKHNVIIDPDFSVILDSNSASSKSGSICSSKSKLSGAKIAGIVIGCVAFISVIIVAVLYHIVKKKKNAKFFANVNQKMKQLN